MKTYMMMAAVALVTVGCGGSNEAQQTAQADAATDATAEAPELMASAAAPGGVVPGGAVDVLQREGWRVDPGVQQADAAPAAGTGQPG